ncbi:Hsp33 family molecular chaperone HslO [Ureibacillus sp. Re31]|uniref:33 kDa chaperonin n=1 Tax=Ureibacillus galli TaxID=2762222 RepID=A0ABR8XB52_9BACL|nr:Hsp33 family molecular chaperone HslO [Ureibacillus galli]MBD8026201.1 Hsp33 family molecular chaperone HslO [Ureibacillus galli]
MKDYLVRAIGFNGQVRAFAARTTETVGEAQRRHHTWPVVSAALGRTMTASVMMGAMLKGEDKISVKVQGNGPIGGVVVDTDAKGNVRGFVSNGQVHFDLNEQGKLDVRAGVGEEGTLTVVKDLGMKEMFSSQVPIVSGEIAEDFTYYFATSEQVSSSVGLGVLVNPDNTILAAGGFIIQLMPGCEESTIAALEQHLTTIEPVSKMIEKGLTPEEILQAVLGKDSDIQILSSMPVHFQCDCSKERYSRALVGLGAKELEEMIEEEGQIETQCHFCLETYEFTQNELQSLVDEIKSYVH